MKTIGFFVIALMIAMVSATSAASVDIVHKDTTTWNEIDSAGLLEYTMPCTGEVMNYTFTIVEPSNMSANTSYSLVFYSHNGNGTWNPDTVWNNQNTSLIDNGTTDGSGNLVLTGDFDFSLHGQGLENINDGDDYDGSVKGAKVWLVPSVDYNEAQKKITNWSNSSNFLWETDLVACTNSITIAVRLVVSCPVSFDVSPTNYDYGTLYPGANSTTNPDGGQKIVLSNTGCPDLQIETNTTGIFKNIKYDVDGDGSWNWTDANNLSINVSSGSTKSLNTKICIPSGEIPGTHTGTVTFEYIAVSP